MEPEYNERGNILGPGPSRISPIPRWQSKDDKAVLEHENRYGEEIANISKDVVVTAATQGTFKTPPASQQTVDVAGMEVMDLDPNIYNHAVAYHKKFPDAGWGAALRAAKLTKGTRYDPTVYIPPNERIGTQKGDPLQMSIPKGGADPSGISSELKYGDRQIWENLPTKTQELFTDIGVDSDKAVLLIKNSEGPISREALAAVEGGAFTDATFKFMSSELLPEFLEESKNIDLRGGLQLDHIAQLRAMIPFYEGRNLKQWPKIRRILVKEGIFGGHNPKNLQYLNTPVHQIKTNFWIDQVGKDGSKFFEGRRLETYTQIEAAAKDMKTIINRSNNIVEKLSAQYKLLNQGNDITPIELAAILEKVDLNFGKYNLKDFKRLVKLVNKQELNADTLKLMQGVELQGELDDYTGSVRQVIQDTDPADLPKTRRVTKKDKRKNIKNIVPLTDEQQLNILDETFGIDE